LTRAGDLNPGTVAGAHPSVAGLLCPCRSDCSRGPPVSPHLSPISHRSRDVTAPRCPPVPTDLGLRSAGATLHPPHRSGQAPPLTAWCPSVGPPLLFSPRCRAPLKWSAVAPTLPSFFPFSSCASRAHHPPSRRGTAVTAKNWSRRHRFSSPR
jgi:hypothetical protein